MDTMKTLVIALCLFTGACKKENDKLVMPQNTNPQELVVDDSERLEAKDEADIEANNTDYNPLEGFIQYVIPQGWQNSAQSALKTAKYDSLVFKVMFDSTAIYTTTAKENQGDINKLYGFSDCSSLHQTNSARFGWRYYKNGLELFGYTYANGTRKFITMGSININQIYTCTIVAKKGEYVFYLNGQNPISVERGCNNGGMQYQLYPYFGGDETAPHTIYIWIKEISR